MMTLRICPKRDAVCPHGMDCQFVIDRFNCKDEQDRPVTPAPVGEVLPEFDDPHVQVVYKILCNTSLVPPEEEHWEGFLARHVIAALSPPSDTSGEAVAWRFRRVGSNNWGVRLAPWPDYWGELPLEREPLYPASALAAAEARGVQIGLERAAKVADSWADTTEHLSLIADDELGLLHNGLATDMGRDIAGSIRSLSPAHKGSENV